MKERRRRAWARQGKWGNLQFPDHLLCVSLQFCCGCCLVTRSCPALLRPNGLQPSRPLCPWDFPARILEQVAISFSGGPSQPNDQTCISCIGRWNSLPLSHQESPSASLGTCTFRYIHTHIYLPLGIYIYTFIYFAFPNPTTYVLSSLLYT